MIISVQASNSLPLLHFFVRCFDGFVDHTFVPTENGCYSVAIVRSLTIHHSKKLWLLCSLPRYYINKCTLDSKTAHFRCRRCAEANDQRKTECVRRGRSGDTFRLLVAGIKIISFYFSSNVNKGPMAVLESICDRCTVFRSALLLFLYLALIEMYHIYISCSCVWIPCVCVCVALDKATCHSTPTGAQPCR